MMKRTGKRSMQNLIRKTVSVSPDDYSSFKKLAKDTDVSVSWLLRQAMRDFLERYGEQGQPELALRLGSRR